MCELEGANVRFESTHGDDVGLRERKFDFGVLPYNTSDGIPTHCVGKNEIGLIGLIMPLLFESP
jgi:hypothetical protein